VVLQMANLALAVAIWFPFVRRYDRQLVARERELEAAAR
jgi:cellobiose-specific phosphotransferase system component IIC